MHTMRKNSGFSLPELLLTALILAYSLSVILSTYTNSMALNDSSRNLTIATSHAQYVMESIRNATFSTLASNITSGTWNWDSAEVAGQGLKVLDSESIVVTYTGTNPLTITVTVSWQDLKGRNRTKTIMSMVSG